MLVIGIACAYIAPTARDTVQQWNAAAPPSWTGSPPGSGDPLLPHYDLDTWLIHGGLVKAPRFRDTLHWWTGTWAGQVPFYRPIPSMVFWAEWKLFGDREIRYRPFAILLHLLVVYQFLRLAGDLARHFRTPSPESVMLLSGLIFVNGFYVLPHQAGINAQVFELWKNQPDSLCALFLILAVRRYLSAAQPRPSDENTRQEERPAPWPGGENTRQEYRPAPWQGVENTRTQGVPEKTSVGYPLGGTENAGSNLGFASRPGCTRRLSFLAGCFQHPKPVDMSAAKPASDVELEGGRKSWFGQLRGLAARYAPLGFYLACCASKETGVFLPLLLPLLEWPALAGRNRDLRSRAIARLLPLLAALPLFLAFRALCLHMLTAFTYGSNGSWRDRLLAESLGPLSFSATHGDWLPIGAAAAVLALILAASIRGRKYARLLLLAELPVWAAVAVGLLWLVGLLSLGRQEFSNLGLPGVIWMLSEPSCAITAIGALLTLLALVGGFRQSPPLTLFCYGWVILCVAINSFSPPTAHRYYLTNAGFALLCGTGLSLWVVRGHSWWAGRSHS